MIEFNELQTSYEDLELNNYSKETQDQFLDCINNIPFIRNLINKDRKRVVDLEKDSEGKIIVDITNPHILENMDYFRPSAIHYQKYGCFTKLRPNKNPNSEFYKWFIEEIRRCREGLVREDGEWIPGDLYFFWNYCPIQLIKKDSNNKDIRVIDFPRPWDGHYLIAHYLYGARASGHHASELASRGKGKSFFGASLLAKRFILGESEEVKQKVQCVVTASEKKYLSGANQILDMFQYYIDFIAKNTQFPSRRLTDTMQNLQWTMGYKDKETNVRKGSQNSVIGITSKDDESKLRGSRGVLYLIEEAGTFPRLLNLYQVLRPSVEDGSAVFGLIFMYGTAGDQESDFASLQEIMYNPLGYNMHPTSNVYDKEGQGRKLFTYFFPAYLNRAECYDNNGNSNVTKAIIEILHDRYLVKYNSSDINAITKRIAEYPITPQEAIIRSRASIFPITELNERLNQIDNNPKIFDDVIVGDLVFNKSNTVELKISNDKPIHDFPTKDNKVTGALEIFALPEKKDNKVFSERYIISADPYDDDVSNTMSLGSLFVMDLWSDTIVAEYTGRPLFADDFFELARKLCLFYNAKCMYENNKKGLFSYFSRMQCTHLLADTPEYLRDKQLIKEIGYGNKAKGVVATVAIKAYGFKLIRDWLLKPIEVTEPGETEEESHIITIPNLYRLKNRALLKELIQWNPNINVDRIMSLVQLMLYREEKMVLYGGQLDRGKETKTSSLANDEFFIKNYDNRLSVKNLNISKFKF